MIHARVMAIPEFLGTATALTITNQTRILNYFWKQSTSMGSPQGLDVTKELKTMEWDTSCYLTLNVVQDEEALFPEEVSRIKGWRDFGVIYFWGA